MNGKAHVGTHTHTIPLSSFHLNLCIHPHLDLTVTSSQTAVGPLTIELIQINLVAVLHFCYQHQFRVFISVERNEYF